METLLITYAVMGKLCSRAEALEYWRLECLRAGMDVRKWYFEQAETAGAQGVRYRQMLKLIADLTITVTVEE